MWNNKLQESSTDEHFDLDLLLIFKEREGHVLVILQAGWRTNGLGMGLGLSNYWIGKSGSR
jgi:hypothetical protein